MPTATPELVALLIGLACLAMASAGITHGRSQSAPLELAAIGYILLFASLVSVALTALRVLGCL